ncbi:MAG: hypothetical protein Q4F34_07280 [Prevotellaceae bacterium]|nr:hypothetical protein [Prevotellaceae bacterium]
MGCVDPSVEYIQKVEEIRKFQVEAWNADDGCSCIVAMKMPYDFSLV